MVDFMARSELVAVLSGSDAISGKMSIFEVLETEPDLKIEVSNGVLGLHAYEARIQRWEDGEGPMLHGAHHFVKTLENLQGATTCIASVYGKVTKYILLLTVDRTELLTSIAIDDR